MPIGAIAGATAVAGVGSAAIGANASKKAANKAANTSLQTAQQNNALQREVYYNNVGLAEPFREGGLRAFNAMNDLLGLGSAPSGGNALAAPPAAPSPSFSGGGFQGGYSVPGEPGAFFQPREAITSDGAFAGNMQFGAPAPVNATVGPAASAAPAKSAFQNWLDSTDYQFTLGEGFNALNHGYAARGSLESGAALKALTKFGQNHARGYLDNYMNRLGGQQGIGLSANNAVMGVGTNYANAVSQNNTNAGNAAANSMLASGAATANLWGNAGSSIGNALGQLGSSYIGRGR